MVEDSIRDWFAEGKSLGATHLVVVCDTFEEPDLEDHSCYPIYVMSGQDPRDIAADYGWDEENPHSTRDMQKVMEVYRLDQDMEEQINTPIESSPTELLSRELVNILVEHNVNLPKVRLRKRIFNW